MKSNKKFYQDINLIRLLACFAILLYHFNILKGGYLAVCTFFVLSGYLSCISAFKKEKFSLLSYYSNRLLKIYLPLVVAVFMTISIVSIFPNMNWFNLKPETTSVLLGYNNFWQLSANLDYFARHINSPFMHLWYIAILLQFDLVFPFLYIILRKIGDKINKMIPCIIMILLSGISVLYFYIMSCSQNIMITYYHTFTRIFSLLFGLSLGFIHSYYKPSVLKKESLSKVIFYTYLFILICFFVFIDANSIYFSFGMIAVTFITCKLLDYGTIHIKKDLSIYDKGINFITEISYEIYLFQYPVIFLFQYININQYIKLPIMIILILGLSYLLHFCMNWNHKHQKLKITIGIIILCTCLYGGYQYCVSEDHTLEMKQLEEQLAENEKILQKKQEEYLSKQKQQEDDWIKKLSDLENGEKELKDIVTNLSVIGVGDSVMLGTIGNLYQVFPNGYFDAQTSRTAWEVNDILQSLKNRNRLGNPIILNLGANGDCPESCKKEIMETCKDRKVFWINITNDNEVHVNDKLLSLASIYDNLHIIDWNSLSSGHSEYFIADGIHLTEIGRKEYAKVIYDAIYQTYLEEYKEKKEELIREHEEEHKNKISFYGNDILLNVFESIHDDFSDANFMINSEFNYKTVKEEIQKQVKDNTLTNGIVFAFDNRSELSSSEYQDLIELCLNHEIYILATSEKIINDLSSLNYENVTIINFYQEIKSHSNYLMIDGVHLTEEGNQALSRMLKDMIM